MPRHRALLKGCGLRGILLVTILAIVIGLANVAWDSMHRPFLDRLKQVRHGCTEARVVELLGEPTDIRETGDSVDWDIEYSTYGHPRNWTIEDRVLVFIGPTDRVPSDYIVFVRIGGDGRVEETYVGGT